MGKVRLPGGAFSCAFEVVKDFQLRWGRLGIFCATDGDGVCSDGAERLSVNSFFAIKPERNAVV